MDATTSQRWWQLHLRVAKGESLGLSEQTEYESGLEALDQEEKEMHKIHTRELIAIQPDIVVSIYNDRFNGYVRVHPDGYVELTSPAGTVVARFKELEKADWLRESYIRMLIGSGMQGQELTETLAAIERVDLRLQQSDRTEARARLYERSQQQFREWCARQGINYDELTDEKVMQIVSKGVEAVRSEARAAGDE